ncbi:uncharacterized protein VTP21DRAFT_9356 [Calcarisporiella thermophila]|uniref:uncharacterized protein n=1 Tax=Calcarisporiella thermophila TaxID=911321 RepID=UPI003742298D
MGVLNLFHWISSRYPSCIKTSVGQQHEADNLYVDMNGVIHDCLNSLTQKRHCDETAIIRNVLYYIDHLVELLKPRKTVFLSMDGVAPRAKMHQQRVRRFRTAMTSGKSTEFDRNSITAGTRFMATLTQELHNFIVYKCERYRTWQEVEVALSGQDMPGEGEYKIMQHIRQHGSDSTRCLVYSRDADFILMSLVSRRLVTLISKKSSNTFKPTKFTAIEIPILRDCLYREFLPLQDSIPFHLDSGRLADDFVLLALLVGNDFIPPLSFNTQTPAISFIFEAYKRILPRWDGWIADRELINTARLEMLLKSLTEQERNYFVAEWMDAQWGSSSGSAVMTPRQNTIYRDILSISQEEPKCDESSRKLYLAKFAPSCVDRHFAEIVARDLGLQVCARGCHGEAEVLEKDPLLGGLTLARGKNKRMIAKYERAKVLQPREGESAEDVERALWVDQYASQRRAYYTAKLKLNCDNQEQLTNVVHAYIEGIQWALNYFHGIISSWDFHYPYLHAPHISDFVDLDRFQIAFVLGEPVGALEQLLCILPPASSRLLPVALRSLVTRADSPLANYYNHCEKLTRGGHQQALKLHFIDKRCLQAILKDAKTMLKAEELACLEIGGLRMYHYNEKQREVAISLNEH